MSGKHQDIQEQKRMGLVMQALAWVVLIGLGVVFFGDMLEKQFNPNQSLETRHDGGMKEVALQRNKFGHYVTSGEINGQPVTFLLDTGATGVAVPLAVAQRLGLQAGRPFKTRTANGTSTSYAASLERVSVGDIELRNVQAGITPGLDMEQVLLGMSFLKHIEFTQRGDTLLLRQYR
jgi:aspartyl protease family protein